MTATFRLTMLYFYLTGGCNCACRHCWIAPTYQSGEKTYPALDVDLFCSILRQAKRLGLSRVKLTGGEPLLHPRIRDILAVVKAEGLRLTMETNGMLCTPEMARALRASGAYHVAVSLDGADAETHEWMRNVPGSFALAKSGIKNLVDAGIRPQVIMSIVRRNGDQMEDVVRLAEVLGASSVKFNPVQPTARGETMHAAGETLAIEELVELGAWVESSLSAATRLRLYYSHPMAFRPMGKMFGQNGGCGVCTIFSILGVLADGSYALCGIGAQVPELIFGHSASDRLDTVWNETPILREIREGLPARLKGICNSCIMKSRCLGNCIAQNYYTHKDLWAPGWYCEEAARKGLFPVSRKRHSSYAVHARLSVERPEPVFCTSTSRR